MKVDRERKYTMWTAPASPTVPALAQLDMDAPITGHEEARRLAREANERAKKMMRFFERRPVASQRKRVK